MGSTTTVLTVNGLALRENCRWLVEQWLQRDLRRLMQISSQVIKENGTNITVSSTALTIQYSHPNLNASRHYQRPTASTRKPVANRLAFPEKYNFRNGQGR